MSSPGSAKVPKQKLVVLQGADSWPLSGDQVPNFTGKDAIQCLLQEGWTIKSIHLAAALHKKFECAAGYVLMEKA